MKMLSEDDESRVTVRVLAVEVPVPATASREIIEIALP